MNQNPQDHWRNPGGPPQPDPQAQGRPYGGFGGHVPPQCLRYHQLTLSRPNEPPQGPPHVLPPPSASYHQHHTGSTGGHSLSIANLTQGPQPQHQYNGHPPPHSQGPHIPPLGHGPMQHSPQYLNRDRENAERREREMRDQEMREREYRDRERELHHRHHEEMVQREREARDRQDRLHREQEQRPVQSHAGSIPLHQPVANKGQNPIHGPNGLLSNNAAGPPNLPNASGPGGIFGGPPPEQPRAQFLQQPPQPIPVQAPAQQSAAAFIGGPSPMQQAAQLPHGQQPILNDALSYLDQVKVRFSEYPDVYNRFLDIMKDFKSQAIDTPGVIERVSNLFNGHPALIQGFNTFLPPGYRIECGTEDNPDTIRVTTPSGTMTQSLQARSRPYEASGLSNQTQPGLGRQDTFEDGRSTWSQAPEDSATIHQQEQRGVSSLQTAVASAATQRGSLPSPPRDQAQQQGAAFGAANDLKRSGGPVEFNHAISYVNKIKVSSSVLLFVVLCHFTIVTA
jgi:paired amphipathic helix protein Sin3a